MSERMEKKITVNEFLDFIQKYYENREVSPEFQEIRFGQYFCNLFDITDDKLFYAKDRKAAQLIIFEKYLDYGN